MLYTALLFGLLSSLHCVGMCGPIALMLPVGNSKGIAKYSRIALYHLGRLSAYASIGLLFGLVGRGLFLAGVQQRLSLVIGVAMIIVSLVSEKVWENMPFQNLFFGCWQNSKRLWAHNLKAGPCARFSPSDSSTGFCPAAWFMWLCLAL